MKMLIIVLFLPLLVWSKDFVPSSFSAHYEESLISVKDGKEKKSFGKIDYKFPGHIRYEVTSPDPSIFISNPQKSWYYTPPFIEGEEGQVSIQKSNKLPLTKFLDSMKGGIDKSKLFQAKYQGKELVLIFDRTIQKEMTLKQVIFISSKDSKTVKSLSEFEKMTLIYTDGRKVNLKFIDLKANVSYDNKHFTFEIPPKTKVVN